MVSPALTGPHHRISHLAKGVWCRAVVGPLLGYEPVGLGYVLAQQRGVSDDHGGHCQHSPVIFPADARTLKPWVRVLGEQSVLGDVVLSDFYFGVGTGLPRLHRVIIPKFFLLI